MKKINHKILLVGMYPPPYGGITVHIERLKRILDKSRNYKCYVLDLSGVESNEKNKNRNIILVKGNKIVRLIKALVRIKRFKGDIIHFHVSAFGNFKYVGILLVHSNNQAKKILTIHSGSFIQNYKKGSWIQKKMVIWSLKSFDYIISVNKLQANFIRENLKIKSRIVVIPAFLPPVYPENIILKDEISSFKKKFQKVIVTSGFMLRYYGFHIIIEAFNEIANSHLFRAGLIIVYYTKEDLSYKNEILNMVKGKANIKMYSSLDPASFATILRECSIFVRATDRDGDAVALREAAFFNKQVIASDCVERPKGVLLFKTMDKNDLKEKMKIALSDPNYGKAESSEKYGEKLIQLYNIIVSEKKKGA